MKKALIGLALILLASVFIMGQSDWHIKRNKYNKLPEGVLKNLEGTLYADETGRKWELQPHIKNKFHQPEQEVAPMDKPYPNIVGPLEFDTKNSNLKFLSEDDEGGSYEAILQPNGEYLVEGPKQGTYNYSNPSGFSGSIKHTFLDVIPHFINSTYSN